MITQLENVKNDNPFTRELITLYADIGSELSGGDELLQIGTLAVSAGDATKFKTTTVVIFTEGGIQRSLAATDNLAFADAYTINTGAATGDFWGAFLVEATGVDTPVITAKASAADQVYASEAAAIAALPAVTAGSKRIGYITVQANTDTDWVAQTDDLTAASDCQAVNFYDDAALEAGTQSGVLFDAVTPGYAFEIVGAEFICEEVQATATIQLKAGSREAVAAVAPVANTLTTATLTTTAANKVGTASEAIGLYVTSNAAGYAKGVKVHVAIRPQGLRPA
jgi:hypothetical protein